MESEIAHSGENCRVLISCADGAGIIAAVSGLIAERGGNILDADQHTELATEPGTPGLFFMRVVAEVGTGSRESLQAGFDELAARLDMRISLHWGDRPDRVAILSGPETHCLSDLLWRWGQGELGGLVGGDIVGVLSNHDSGRAMTESMGVEFACVPESGGDRDAQERAVGDWLDRVRPDLVVLARYMRVLPSWLVERYDGRMINIHHGFLPAFAGARPYHQAHARGVKLIGATSHYVTAELDDGPIIAQETAHVSHRDDIVSMKRLGRDLERVVLARAVRQHLERRVLVVGRRTVVFE